MSGDRRTRRRFLADILFAGGAMTAASVLGYVATHEEVAVPAPVTPRVQPAGDVAPVRPEGQAIAPPQAAASPRYDLRAAGGEEPYVPGRETRGRCK